MVREPRDRENSGPLAKTLSAWQAQERVLYSMPGHKGTASFWAPLGRDQDVTEHPGFDDLLSPRGILRESGEQAARAYGVARSFFLVNGASGGLRAALFALPEEIREVLVPRNVHRSVLEGLILRDLEPVFPDPEPGRDPCLPPSPAAYGRFPGHRAAVVVTETYEGALTDYRSLEDKILLADEAHGSHLFHLGAPSAVEYADVTVHGTHKTLGSLTQSGLLHLREEAGAGRVQAALGLMQTTSPSWLLLRSVEEAVAWWVRARQTGLLEERCARVRHLAGRIGEIPGLRPRFSEGTGTDPLRLAIQVSRPWRAGALRDALAAGHGIWMEGAWGDTLVGIAGPFDDPAADDRLLTALAALSRDLGMRDGFPAAPPAPGSRPARGMRIREAFLADAEEIPLARARGRLAAGLVGLYPPGIPLAIPGDVLEPAVLESIRDAGRDGETLQGITDGCIRAVRE